jgi:hypothetical protein
MTKGLSSVIAAILILLITIAILGMAFLSLQRTAQTTMTTTESVSGQTQQQAAYNFKIENVDYIAGIISLRNIGSAQLNNLGFYVDDQPVTATYSPISPGSVGDILLGQPLEQGTHTIRITSGGIEQSITVTIPETWFVDLNIEGF